MKRILTFVIFAILSLNVNAQTTLTEAVDFTGTECYGEKEIHLFDILDGGQHVLIDFYFYACNPCHRIAPYVEEAYRAFGSNNNDVFFMGVSPDDADFLCQYYAEKYGIEYPIIGKESVGKEIQMDYGVRSYPTLVLIAPDRQILLQDINYDSIKARESQYIIEQLEQFGIKQYNSGDEGEEPGDGEEPGEEVGVSVVDIQVEVMSNTSVYIVATPNEETEEYRYILIERAHADSIGIDSTMSILHEDTRVLYDADEYEWLDLKPITDYYAVAQGKNINGEWGEITKVKFYTSLEGNIELVENKFKVYPNPVSDRLFIETEVEIKEVAIYDIFGRLQVNKTTSQQVVDVTDLNSGVYFVKIKTNEGVVTKRFITN